MTLKVTWQACYLYALSFGGYVAFSVFLPTMLQNCGLEAADASFRMAGFVIVAVIMPRCWQLSPTASAPPAPC